MYRHLHRASNCLPQRWTLGMSAYADSRLPPATVICMDYDGYNYQGTSVPFTILNLSYEDIVKSSDVR